MSYLSSVWVLRGAAGLSVLLATSPRLPAQSAAGAHSQFTFEVAAVRMNKSGETRTSGGFQPSGRYRVSNYTLRALIAAAYVRPQVNPDFLIAGGPKWIDSDRFDVEAKAAEDFPPGPDASSSQRRKTMPAQFVGLLPRFVNRIVVDSTGLSGRLDTSKNNSG